MHMLKRHCKGVVGVCFSRDSRTIVSASYDKTVCIWHVEIGPARSAAVLKLIAEMRFPLAKTPD